jgi:hypothetical protein
LAKLRLAEKLAAEKNKTGDQNNAKNQSNERDEELDFMIDP